MLTEEKEHLIKILEQLPDGAQHEILDFAEFLAAKSPQLGQACQQTDSVLSQLIAVPLRVPGFKPLSRDECHAR